MLKRNLNQIFLRTNVLATGDTPGSGNMELRHKEPGMQRQKAKPADMNTVFQAKRYVLFRALWDGVVTAKRFQKGKGVGKFILGNLLTLMSWYTPKRGKLKLLEDSEVVYPEVN